MTWEQFLKKIKPLLKSDKESIAVLGFKFNKEKYRIHSQWGSGEKREFVNLWGKKIDDKNKSRVYPFIAEQVDKLKFFRI